ncbi:hypothetical protein [Proteiniphilum sp. X52]|nr:hypothetical protein [Proteiniphilum sp. X52]
MDEPLKKGQTQLTEKQVEKQEKNEAKENKQSGTPKKSRRYKM